MNTLPFFVRACGFIEFCCTWHIYTGKSASYAAIGVLAMFVVLAFIPFGLTDFIGHFLFIIPLIAILFSPKKADFKFSALSSTLFFLCSLVIYFVFAYTSYYILHFQLHPTWF